ncbi:unnamed protein product [Rangifer tarandus platyrhynchus]|uniref:Uncharacterized protein n=1 Tax=Rangifer tarandus platyrhynchus TaxID=3082113 RepID=A0AC59YAY5_RANTA
MKRPINAFARPPRPLMPRPRPSGCPETPERGIPPPAASLLPQNRKIISANATPHHDAPVRGTKAVPIGGAPGDWRLAAGSDAHGRAERRRPISGCPGNRARLRQRPPGGGA